MTRTPRYNRIKLIDEIDAALQAHDKTHEGGDCSICYKLREVRERETVRRNEINKGLKGGNACATVGNVKEARLLIGLLGLPVAAVAEPIVEMVPEAPVIDLPPTA